MRMLSTNQIAHNLFVDDMMELFFYNFMIYQLFSSILELPVKPSPSLRNFCLKELFTTEINSCKGLNDFHLKLLFKGKENNFSD